MSSYQNLFNLVSLAAPRDVALGMEAYYGYHETLSEVAQCVGMPLPVVCGVFAALSPNNDYLGNLRSCLTLCGGYREGISYSRVVVTTYGANKRKAWAIAGGTHPYEVFKGLKVRNFWRNLSEPDHPEAVTIDGHMENIFLNRVQPLSKGGFSKGKYYTYAQVVRRLAARRDILPSQAQAIAWFAWKRKNRIKMDNQGWLFPDMEQVRPVYRVLDIKPFPYKV